jgi:anti-sigma-K factor RskA
MSHEEIKELLALEAMGALHDEEGRQVAAHLSSCDECRRELIELRNAAAALAYAVEPVAPPAYLRKRVLDRIHGEQIATAPAAIESKVEIATPRGVEAGAGAPTGYGSIEDARALLRRLGLWDIFSARPALGLGAFASVALVAALGLTSLLLWNRNTDLRTEVASLTERLTEAEAETARGRELLARTQEVNDLLTSPGISVAQLAGTKVAPQAAARVAFERTSGRVLVVANNLPAAPAGKGYQLWFIAGGKTLPGRVFKVGPDGRGLLTDQAPASAGPAPAFAVTLEDERGVPVAEGEIYLLSSAS